MVAECLRPPKRLLFSILTSAALCFESTLYHFLRKFFSVINKYSRQKIEYNFGIEACTKSRVLSTCTKASI